MSIDDIPGGLQGAGFRAFQQTRLFQGAGIGMYIFVVTCQCGCQRSHTHRPQLAERPQHLQAPRGNHRQQHGEVFEIQVNLRELGVRSLIYEKQFANLTPT